MNTQQARITVSIAQTPEEISQALAFCGSIYERSYNTHWITPPDLFFVAKENGQIVATGGLTFAALHPEIASERYFRLTDGMRHFVNSNRERIVEFGRFASIKAVAAKAILHSALCYSTLAGIDFIFAWANPAISKYTTNRLGLNFWPITVPLDLDNALNDSRWSSPPTGFFVREHPPALHLGVVPFWEGVTRTLAQECGYETAAPAWQTHIPDSVHVAMKRTSFVVSAPKLLRAGGDIPDSRAAKPTTLPDFEPRFGAGIEVAKGQPKAD